ncbi:MAG: hypothetical protein ACRDV7_06605, partial [Acidimicrobiia bacterium]
MTRSDDELLRDALRAEAGPADETVEGFAAVRDSAHRRMHGRRRAMLAAAAAVTVVALGAGTVYAVSRDNDGGGISAGPSDTTVVTDPPGTTSSAPSSTTPPSTVPPTTAPPPPAPTTVPVEPVTGTLPPPADVAGVTKYATVGLDALPPELIAEAASPQQKVDALVAFLENEPIEGRRGAQGVVNSV